MPLPPLPANNTDVAWLKYTSMGQEHELMFRQPSITPQADIIANAVALATALKVMMHNTDSFTGLRHRDSGSTVSFPLAWTSIAGTASAGGFNADDKAKFIALSGRSLAGYRCKMTFFTPYIADAWGYRQARVSGNHVDTFLDAVDAAEPPFVAVDGSEVIWNQYGNLGFNAYWQRQLR